MASHSTSHHIKNSERGFSLIEIVIVIALLGFVLTLGLIATLDSYKGYLFRSEQSTIVSVLSRARNQSLANINQTPHGVCYDGSSNYIMFEGANYGVGTRKIPIAANPGVVITPNPSNFFCSSNVGVVFAQLTGKATAISFVITQNNRTSTISINNEGTINW